MRAGLIIPAGYGANVAGGQKASVAFVIDGSDPTVANTAFAASQQVGQAHGVELIERRLGISTAEMTMLSVHPRVWYNPDLKSVNFMVPGLIATIVFILTMFMTGLTIVQEREPSITGEDAVAALRVVEAVYRSAENGRWTPVQTAPD